MGAHVEQQAPSSVGWWAGVLCQQHPVGSQRATGAAASGLGGVLAGLHLVCHILAGYRKWLA